MAVKTKKKTVSKAKAKKKTTVAAKTKKKTAKPKIKKGSKYQCSVCGIAVRVDEVCGCVDVCDIICCGKQMKPKKK
jgi:hypothetical protein